MADLSNLLHRLDSGLRYSTSWESQTPTVNNSYPWLKKEYVDVIEKATSNISDQNQKKYVQQKMYSDLYKQQRLEEQQNDRADMKNELIYRSENSNNQQEKEMTNINIKKANLADMIRDKYKLDLNDWDDDTVINTYVSQIYKWDQLLLDYYNWKNDKLFETNVVLRNQPNKSDTVMTSSSKFDNDNYVANYLNDTLKNDKEYITFVNAAREYWYSPQEIAVAIEADKQTIEANKQYQAYLSRGLWDKTDELDTWAWEWVVRYFVNLYNNLLWNNPYIWVAPQVSTRWIDEGTANQLATDYDPTWQLRSESWWTNAGRTSWKVWASIITNVALMQLLPWMWADNLTVDWLKQLAAEWWSSAVKQAIIDRTIIWAAEWWLGWFIDSSWQENPQQSMKKSIPLWIVIGGVLWLAQWLWTNYKAEHSLMQQLDDIKNSPEYKNNQDVQNKVDVTKESLRDKYKKWVRPTSQDRQTTASETKAIDDWINWVETIVKRKDKLKFLDSDWEMVKGNGRLPKNNQEFADSIQQIKKDIYDEYHQIVKDTWWQWAKVSTKPIIDELKKIVNDDVTMAGNRDLKWYIDDWIEDLEKIDWLSPERAEEKIAELNTKLTKNMTQSEVNRNLVNSLIKNKMKESLDDSIDDILWSSSKYNSLRKEYSFLRNIEKDVNHRALVIWRRNPVWLNDTIANIQSAEDFIKAAAWSKEGLASFIAKQWLKAWAKHLNNPDTYIKSLFKEVDSIVNANWSESWADIIQAWENLWK